MKKYVKKLTVLLLAVVLLVALPGATQSAKAADPGKTPSTALTLTLGETLKGVFADNNDYYWYQFTLENSGVVTFLAEKNCWAYVYAADDLSENDAINSFPINDNDMEHVSLRGGTYYLKIAYLWGDSFALETSFADSQDGGGSNYKFSSAQPITLGEVVKGNLDEQSNKDFYSFTLEESGEVLVTPDEDVWVYIHSAEAAYNASDAICGELVIADQTQVFSLRGGSYVMEVRYYTKNCNYTMETKFKGSGDGGGANVKFSTATELPASGTNLIYGNIDEDARNDFYKVTLPANGKLLITTNKSMPMKVYEEENLDSFLTYEYPLADYTLTIELDKGTYYLVMGEAGVNNYNFEFAFRCKSHKYVETITQKGGFNVTGNLHKACSVCGYEKDVEIPAITKLFLSYTVKTYNGKVQKPYVTAYFESDELLKGDWADTPTYSKGCKYVGTYKVTVKLKGYYSGTKTLTYKIRPKSTYITKLTAGKKSFNVSWKKQATQTTGYEIRYSTSSKMTNAKTASVGKNSILGLSIGRLTAKKKYYVQVRTYKSVNGTKIYSSWSAKKSIVTK